MRRQSVQGEPTSRAHTMSSAVHTEGGKEEQPAGLWNGTRRCHVFLSAKSLLRQTAPVCRRSRGGGGGKPFRHGVIQCKCPVKVFVWGGGRAGKY